MPVCFLTIDRKVVKPKGRGGGEKLGGVGGREKCNQIIYCMKNNPFSIKEKKKRLTNSLGPRPPRAGVKVDRRINPGKVAVASVI